MRPPTRIHQGSNDRRLDLRSDRSIGSSSQRVARTTIWGDGIHSLACLDRSIDRRAGRCAAALSRTRVGCWRLGIAFTTTADAISEGLNHTFKKSQNAPAACHTEVVLVIILVPLSGPFLSFRLVLFVGFGDRGALCSNALYPLPLIRLVCCALCINLCRTFCFPSPPIYYLVCLLACLLGHITCRHTPSSNGGR